LYTTQNFSQHYSIEALLVKGSVFPQKLSPLLQNDSVSKNSKIGKKYPSCKFHAKLWVFLAFKLDAQENVCDGIEIWVTA